MISQLRSLLTSVFEKVLMIAPSSTARITLFAESLRGQRFYPSVWRFPSTKTMIFRGRSGTAAETVVHIVTPLLRPMYRCPPFRFEYAFDRRFSRSTRQTLSRLWLRADHICRESARKRCPITRIVDSRSRDPACRTSGTFVPAVPLEDGFIIKWFNTVSVCPTVASLRFRQAEFNPLPFPRKRQLRNLLLSRLELSVCGFRDKYPKWKSVRDFME